MVSPPPQTFDPDDLAAIGDALAAHLSRRFRNVALIGGPRRYGRGLDTYVYEVALAGDLPPEWARPLVLRVYPNADQKEKATREAAVQTFAVSRGIAAPRPLLVETSWDPYGLPIMIMERVPGAPLIDLFKNPLRINAAIKSMVKFQARLHSVPIDGCPLPYDCPLVDRWLEGPRRQVEEFEPPESAGRLRWLEENASIVRDEEPVLLHNDFHPLNLLVDGDRLTLLDWPDAALGDRHCDVARTLALFWLAPPLESNRLLRTALTVLRRYIVSAYAREYRVRSPLDEDRLRYWQAMHAFRAWLQIAVMRIAGEEAIGARTGVLAQIPPALEPALLSYFQERAI